MDRPTFFKEVLEALAVIDAHESVAAEDAEKVRKALERVVQHYQARDLLQTDVGDDIDEAIAMPLIQLVAYELAPSYVYPRDQFNPALEEMRLHAVVSAPYRSQPLKKCQFL